MALTYVSVQIPDWTVDIDTMTEADIREEYRVLSQRVSVVDTRRHKLRAWLNALEEKRRAKAAFNRLSPEEQRALVKLVLEQMA